MKNKPKPLIGNVRDAALTMLLEIDQQQAYSNLLIHKTIEKYEISPVDRGLLTELTYGTLQQTMTLDYYIAPYVRGKLHPWVRRLLHLSVYQLVYLSKIPPHAAVNEAVEIAKKRGHKRIAPTVNGILRSLIREGVPSIEEIKNPVERISIETSHPEWLITRWIEQYGEETTLELAHENNYPAALTIRVNETKASVEDVQRALEKEGFTTTRGELIPVCLHVEGGNPSKTNAFQKGWFTIQDESSMVPAYALQVEQNHTVLDMCAAPGGKTTHLAERMGDKGIIHAYDIHQHKVQLIEKNAERLGLQAIQAKKGDSRELTDIYGTAYFDRILVDAPCSGFGVIRRKPEIKYRKTRQDVQQLAIIQLNLLKEAVQLIKPGGIIVYSTCTIDATENEDVMKQLLLQEPKMSLIETTLPNLQSQRMIQILPQQYGGDGFFVAALQKAK